LAKPLSANQQSIFTNQLKIHFMKKIYFFLVAAILSSAGISAQCIQNGNFEKVVNPWKFKHRAQSYTQVGCNINTSAAAGFASFAMSTVPDQFSAPFGTIVSIGSDPFLASCSPAVNIPRVVLNKFAIKLNINDGNADVTSMYQNFTGGEFISFQYAFSAQNSHQGDPDHQPFFTARITDPSGNIIASYCLKADSTDPIFGATTGPGGGEMLYTGWRCQTLYIPRDYKGKQLIMEFVVADCGASRDFGTVYLDNVNCQEACGAQEARMMPQTDKLLSAYPNPVNDVLTISGAESTGTFVLFDMFGKQLIRLDNSQKASELTIDVSGLAPGMYLLYSDGANATKIIKN